MMFWIRENRCQSVAGFLSRANSGFFGSARGPVTLAVSAASGLIRPPTEQQFARFEFLCRTPVLVVVLVGEMELCEFDSDLLCHVE